MPDTFDDPFDFNERFGDLPDMLTSKLRDGELDINDIIHVVAQMHDPERDATAMFHTALIALGLDDFIDVFPKITIHNMRDHLGISIAVDKGTGFDYAGLDDDTKGRLTHALACVLRAGRVQARADGTRLIIGDTDHGNLFEEQVAEFRAEIAELDEPSGWDRWIG